MVHCRNLAVSTWAWADDVSQDGFEGWQLMVVMVGDGKLRGHRKRKICNGNSQNFLQDHVFLNCFSSVEIGKILFSSMWLFSRVKGPKGGFSTTEKTDSKCFLGGGFKYMFYFHPYLGKIPMLINIFQLGWNHHLVFFEFKLWKLDLICLDEVLLKQRRFYDFWEGEEEYFGRVFALEVLVWWQKPWLERWSLVNQHIKKHGQQIVVKNLQGMDWRSHVKKEWVEVLSCIE